MKLFGFLTAGMALLTACATPGAPEQAAKEMKPHGPHIITVASNNDFETTLAGLQTAIDSRGFKTFAVIDHAAGAASIGSALDPTTLIVFGNPKGGTPILQADQRLGLELPLRILIIEGNNGAVRLIHEDMAHLFHEYQITGLNNNLAKIEAALAAITAEAGASQE